MPPKKPNPGGSAPKKTETATVKGIRELLKDYEIRADRYETTVANSIRKICKKAMDDDRVVHRFLVDPQDRRNVEYLDDDKLVKFLVGDSDETAVRKKKGKSKAVKEDKPLVKVLPLIEAIRAKRYTGINEFFVWDCYVENDDMIALNGLLTRGCYPVQRIELIDCLIDSKSIGILTTGACFCRTLRELCLDFNEIGEKGCRVLCLGLSKSRYLVHLSLSYCSLTKQCGLWLGNLIIETPIRELILDGNALEAEGAIALLSQLSEAAESEGFERAEEIRRQQMAAEEAKQAARRQIDLDNLNENEGEQGAAPASASPPPAPTGKPQSSRSARRNKSPKGKKKKGRRGKKGSKMELPPSGPQISVLKLADTGINHMGRGGNFAPVRCMQLLKSIITHSKDLQEIDLFANEIGDLGARQLLEGILARKEFKLPQIGIRLGYRINQDTFDIIHKLAPGPKRKGKKKGAKAGR